MKTYYPKLFTIVTEMPIWTLTWSSPIKQNHRLHLEGTTSRGYTSLTQELTLTPQFCFAFLSLTQKELVPGCCCLQNTSAWIAGAPFQICLLRKSFTLPYNGFIFIPHPNEVPGVNLALSSQKANCAYTPYSLALTECMLQSKHWK